MKKTQPRLRYMHTLSGKPAVFDGEQVRFARQRVSADELFVPDLKTIRKHQAASAAWRVSQGWPDHFHYGYVLVRFPAPPPEGIA